MKNLILAPLCALTLNISGTASAQYLLSDASPSLFNLARYVRENPKAADLQQYVGPGDAYLFFGDKSKFRLETNLTIDAQGGGILESAGSYARGNYFLDGYVFNKQIADGHILDLGAEANFGSSQMTAYVRVLGEEKYHGSIKTVYDQTFVRDIPFEHTVYGVPMLGVKVTGNVGGELGLHAAPHLRIDKALGVNFTPRLALHGEAAVTAEALMFLTAEARGTVKILQAEFVSSANLGLIPAEKFIYGNVGIDATNISALDGKIELYARTGAGSQVPEGVNGSLWQIVGSLIGNREWRHTLWDPEALFTKTFGYYGRSFATFVSPPASEEACLASQKNLLATLSSRLFQLSMKRETSSGLEAQALAAAEISMGDVRAKTQAICSPDDEESSEETEVARNERPSFWNKFGNAFAPF